MKFERGDKVIIYNEDYGWRIGEFFNYFSVEKKENENDKPQCVVIDWSTGALDKVELNCIIPYSDYRWEKYKYLNKLRQDFIDGIKEFNEFAVAHENDRPTLEPETTEENQDDISTGVNKLDKAIELLKSMNDKLDKLNYPVYPYNPVPVKSPFDPPYTVTCTANSNTPQS